jgi:hypothetical protein
MTDPLATAVKHAIEVCEDLAAAHPDVPISISDSRCVISAPLIPARAGQGTVALVVISDGVHVIAAIKGSTQILSAVFLGFPKRVADPSCPNAGGIVDGVYRDWLGSALESALTLLPAQDGRVAA